MNSHDHHSQTEGSSRPRAQPDPDTVEKWIKVQREGEAQVLAKLREEIGPDGDLKAAYRRWYEEQMREHDEMLIQMLTNLHRASREHASETAGAE